jgi:hypothetical protein
MKASPFTALFLALAATSLACMAEPGQGIPEAPLAPDSGIAAQNDASTATRFHPEGFIDAAVHGLSAKLQELDCRGCHGADLTGGIGPSCDSCHPQNWRTTCTFCHGDKTTGLAAPPRDIRGLTDETMLSFRAHTKHVTETSVKVAFDCTECHTKPTHVLFMGHLFGDPTKGEAEVTFEGGLSMEGTYLNDGKCSNLYCHGNGVNNSGEIDHATFQSTCTSCHPGPRTGAHSKHLEEGAECSDCHGDTADGSNAIRNLALHVNGTVELRLPDGVTRTNARCSGTCHLGDEEEDHEREQWRDD